MQPQENIVIIYFFRFRRPLVAASFATGSGKKEPVTDRAIG
jgi:hypothetical protein